jgi:ATP-dependent Clp protease ATP-binding subunit ClpA
MVDPMAPPPNLQDLIEVVRHDAVTGNALDLLVTASATVAQIEDTSDALLGYFVDRCRLEGRSWSEISAALGVTKQAVHKRFATSVADQIIASIPAPTMERFTVRARVVITSAALAARDAGQERVSSAYILIGLFAEPDGIAGRVLQALGVTREAVRAALQQRQQTAAGGTAGGGTAADGTAADGTAAGGTAASGTTTGDTAAADMEAATAAAAAAANDAATRIPRFTADGRTVLRDALAIALELGHNYIGTEHLLLGLYPSETPAAAILRAAGASEADVRARVLEELRGYQPPPRR